MSTKPKPKVAIIEDDEAIALMYKMKLEISGYEVAHAENGVVGLQLIARFHPDVILLDLMMPVMNGLEVLQALRSKPGMTTAKIVVLSNMGDSETTAKIDRFHVDGHIIKADLTPAQVEQRVKALL